MKKNTLLTLLLTAVFSYTVNSQIQSTGSYLPIGNTIITNVTDDADNGDGVNDGAKLIDGQSEEVGQGAIFTFDGVMESAQNYNITTTIYNSGNSFCGVTVYLYNKTDDTQLTTPTDSDLLGGNIDNLTIPYTSVATDAGDILELRFVRDDNGATSRNFSIDLITLNGVAVGPTPLPEVYEDGEWTPILNTLLVNVTNDEDNGDSLNDGALFVDGQSVEIGQGAKFTFTQKMVSGVAYEIKTTVYNPGTSFCKGNILLYNTSDNTTLSTTTFGVAGAAVQNITLNYTTTATDENDELELRYVKDFDGNTSRDFVIDIATVNGKDLFSTVLSVENNFLTDNTLIYPNPVSGDFITIKTPQINNKILSVDVINVLGKKIGTFTKTNILNTSNYVKGVYFLKIKFDDNITITKKIIKN